MDSFGYKNWGGDDSYDSSPNKYGGYGSKAKSGGKVTKATDAFDYDISSDFADSPPLDTRASKGGKYSTESFGSNRFSAARSRTSVEERTREILERNKKIGKTDGGDDEERMKSYAETFKELTGGLDLKAELEKPKAQKKVDKADTPAGKSTTSMSRSGLDSTLDSPLGGDSLEISAADLEVGALAARRAKEKAEDRRRRMSLDKAPHTLDQSSLSAMYAKRGSASPDIGNKRRSGGDLGGYGGMQFSSALSSIQKSNDGPEGVKGGEFARFGSIERSDDDIYRMLNVTGGTAESLKFGSAAASARNSSQGPALGGRGGGSYRGERGGGRGASGGRGGGAPDGDGDLSDVTQGSRDEDDDSPPRKPLGKATSTAQSTAKPAAVATAATNKSKAGPGGSSAKNADSFYSVPEVDEYGSESGSSGGSDKAHSPVSKSANGSFNSPTDGKGSAGGGAGKAAADDEEDDYSFDDFEQDGQHSPGKATTAAAAATAAADGKPAGGTAATAKISPPELGRSNSQKTLTPTNSTSSMHSGAKSTVALNSVEEIMQRWYTADTDFMQRSLQRIGTGETGFSLDDDDMKPVASASVTGLGKSQTKEGIAMPSNDSFASVSDIGPSAGRSTPAASAPASVPVSSLGATPSVREPSPAAVQRYTPSPLTAGAGAGAASAAPASTAAAPSPAPGIAQPAPGTTTVNDSQSTRSDRTYSSDSSMDGDHTGPGNNAPATAIAAAAPATTHTGTTNTNTTEKTVFDLSDSYNESQPWTQGAADKKSSVATTITTAPTTKPAPAAPEAKPYEMPKLFGARSGGSAYVTVDQLPSFDEESRSSTTPATVPAAADASPPTGPVAMAPIHAQALEPQQPTGFLPRTATATPGSLSPSTAASSRYHEDSDDTRSDVSAAAERVDRRDPLEYVQDKPLQDPAHRPAKAAKQRRESWIVPPKYRSKKDGDQRPHSAPPRGAGKSSEGLPPRKLSANTAAKIKQIKALSPEERRQQRLIAPRRGASTSLTAHSTATVRTRVSKEVEAAVAQQKNAEAVQRLSNDNWRLHRKYERLEAELMEIRVSQQVAAELSTLGLGTTQDSAARLSGAGTGKSVPQRRSPTGLVARIDRADKADKTQRAGKGAKDTTTDTGAAGGNQQREQTAKGPAPLPFAFPNVPNRWAPVDEASASGGDAVWEKEMQNALEHLRNENRKLLEREKAVRVREEAVSIREATVEMKEKLVASSTSAKAEEERNQREFFAKEEIAILREREHALLKENDRLKAALFAHGQDTAAIEELKVRESMGLDSALNLEGDYAPLAKTFASHLHKAGVYGPTVLKPQLKAYYTEKGKAKTAGGGAAADETVTVSKVDYEKLIHDHAEQARLLDAFQKENDRLAQATRAKDAEQQLRNATYYDEREVMNRKLNHLRNATRASGTALTEEPVESTAPKTFDETPLPTSRKTAEMLRMELDADATIRALKEQLQEAQAGMGQREREMQMTIEKLRKENREFAAQLANANLHSVPPQDSDFLQVQTENRVLSEEVRNLKRRVEWFAQNQKLLDVAEEELQQHRQLIAELQRQLQLRGGVDGKVADRLVTPQKGRATVGGATPQSQDMSVAEGADRSTISGVEGRSRHGSSGRSLADIKKIKELEGIIRELQDSLAKRFPDSVFNLVRAAAVSDSVQLRQKQLEHRIEELQRELADDKAKYERSLRTMQQKHEQLKVQYERFHANEAAAERGGAQDAVQEDLGGLAKGSTSSVHTVKTITQALNKIKELENELERTRTFYEKKVKETQRKADAQMRALKRGDEQHAEQGEGVSPEAAEQVRQLQQQAQVYTERIAMLQHELMVTAQELGKYKAAASAEHGQPRQSYIPRPGSIGTPISPTQYARPQASDRDGVVAPLGEQERQQLTAMYQARMEELKTHHNSFVAQLQAQWATERSSLQERLRAEEERCSDLRKELMEAVRSAAHAPLQHISAPIVPQQYVQASPDLKQFAAVESQIEALEVRLQRREKELMAAVEEAKSVAAVERSRLEAIHAQECREKDEQLVRFQHELVQLVNALRHWKQKSDIAILTGAEGGTPAVVV